MKNKLKFQTKEENGITLVALVVTIIVLLILAGVSLNLIAGSNGIMGKAVKSVTVTKETQKEEEIQLKLAEIMMDYYVEGRGQTLQEYIIEKCKENEGDILNVGNGMFSTIDGDLYYTDAEGNTSVIEIDSNGNVTIEGSVSADGSIKDEKAPAISVTTTTNSITFVARDIISGVAGWNYSETKEEPTTWNEVSPNQKSFSYTIENLTNNTTYYIWAKDANGNVSQGKEVRTRDFDELDYEISWENAMATIIVKSQSVGVQFKTSQEGSWENYSASNQPRVASGTTVYFQVTDGTNTKAFETVKPLKISTITYDSNGGEGDFIKKASHTDTILVDFARKPIRANYEFIGWSNRSDVGYADYNEGETSSFTMETEDVTFYAIWKGTTKDTITPANYGDKVNYSANGVSDWNVFLKDETNVYLISSDYVSSNGMAIISGIVMNGSYKLHGNSQNTLINWLTNSSNWSQYAKGINGAVASGGPTLPQFVQSYNAKYGTSYSNDLGENGFYLANKVEPYIVKSTTNALACWLLSISTTKVECVWRVEAYGLVDGGNYGHDRGVRPLVKLPQNIKMTWNGNAWDLSV